MPSIVLYPKKKSIAAESGWSESMDCLRDDMNLDQLWLCHKTVKLIAKYNEYALSYIHGMDPGAAASASGVQEQAKQRNVPPPDLENNVDAISMDVAYDVAHMPVVPRNDLFGRYIKTVKEQAQVAEDTSEHMVIFIFGHGQPLHTNRYTVHGFLLPDLLWPIIIPQQKLSS